MAMISQIDFLHWISDGKLFSRNSSLNTKSSIIFVSCKVWLTRQRRQAFKFDSEFQIYFMIYVNKIVLCEPNEPFYSRIQFGSCLFLSDNGHFINVSIKFWNDFFCIMFFI